MTDSLKIFTTYIPGMSISRLNSLMAKGLSGARFIYKDTEPKSFIEKLLGYQSHFNSQDSSKFIFIIDLPGTKARVGYLDSPIVLQRDAVVNFSTTKGSESVQIVNLDKDKFNRIKENDRILIADDSIEFVVKKKQPNYIQCQSNSPNGTIRPGRSIVFPDSEIVNSALSLQDRRLLQNSAVGKFKIAVSFCHSPKIIETIEEKYKIVRKNIVPKVETILSQDVLKSILFGCEYAILGRGDLSTIHPGEDWFNFQMLFIKTCKENSVNAVIGTGLFPSLSQSSRPKISEVSDVGFLLLNGVQSFLIADDVSFTNPQQVIEIIKRLDSSIRR